MAPLPVGYYSRPMPQRRWADDGQGDQAEPYPTYPRSLAKLTLRIALTRSKGREGEGREGEGREGEGREGEGREGEGRGGEGREGGEGEGIGLTRGSGLR